MSEAAGQRLGQALEQAMACHRAPALLAAAQSRPLPEGMIQLLRLAAGDQAEAAQCAEASGSSAVLVAEAAAFFIQQVLFAPGADSYRILGVSPDAPDARIKEHYRWLVRWLHPDRNTDGWDSVYADRVNIAWQTLRTSERRRSYDLLRDDESLPLAAASHDLTVRPVREPPARLALAEPAMFSADTAAKLPAIVLSGLAGLAVAVLLLMWLGAGREERQAETPAAPAPASEPAAALQAALAGSAAASAPMIETVQAADLERAAEPRLDQGQGDAELAQVQPRTPMAEPAERASVIASAPPGPDAQPALASAAALAPASVPAPAPAAAPAPAPAPASAPAAVVPSSPTLSAASNPPEPADGVVDAAIVQEAQAHELLRRFSLAYEAGNIEALMRLFTSDARNNRGGREAIAYDYQSLFSTTAARELRLAPTGWMARADGGTVLARYEAEVRVDGRARPDISRGNIQFDMRMENGRAKISRVIHE